MHKMWMCILDCTTAYAYQNHARMVQRNSFNFWICNGWRWWYICFPFSVNSAAISLLCVLCTSQLTPKQIFFAIIKSLCCFWICSIYLWDILLIMCMCLCEISEWGKKILPSSVIGMYFHLYAVHIQMPCKDIHIVLHKCTYRIYVHWKREDWDLQRWQQRQSFAIHCSYLIHT